MKKIIIFKIFLLFFSITFGKGMIVTYRAPSAPKDIRYKYPLELIKTAMKKTENEYGAYYLAPSPPMNLARAASPYYLDLLENFIFETSATKEKNSQLLPIKIPIYKGLFGYRLFLINKDNQEEFSKIDSLTKLKTYSIGQGRTWSDVEILRNEGFSVTTGGSYEGLFNMLLSGRFDLFSRGVHEAFEEKLVREDIDKLIVEKDLCLYYPLPRFFYTAKKNTLLAERLEKGLNIMIHDGSFDKIWLKYHGDIIKEADFSNRKIFRINNPLLPDDIPFDNENYWFKP